MLEIGVDTYITVADADSYFAGFYSATDSRFESWDALLDADKERALKWAALAIDVVPLNGEKYVSTQKMQFPRNTDTEIPEQVGFAQAEIAVQSIVGATPQFTAINAGVTSYRIGNFSETFGGSVMNGMMMPVGARSVLACNEAVQWLRPWLLASAVIV